MIYNDNLIRILKGVIDSLLSRKEKPSDALLRLYEFCNTKVKGDEFKVEDFQKIFDVCKAKLVDMAKGGYLPFSSPKDEATFFRRIDNLSIIIIKGKNFPRNYNNVVLKKLPLERFMTIYKVIFVGLANLEERRKNQKVKPIYQNKGDGLYMAVLLAGNIYVFAPRFGLQFDDFHHDVYGMSELFQCEGYKEGFTFSQVLLQGGAYFEYWDNKEWRFWEKGKLNLKMGQQKKITYVADVSYRSARDTKPYEFLLKELKREIEAFVSTHPNVRTAEDLGQVAESLYLKLLDCYKRIHNISDPFFNFYGHERLSELIEKIQGIIAEAKSLFGSIEKGTIRATYFTDPKTGEWRELWGSLNKASREDAVLLDEALRRKMDLFRDVLEDSSLGRRIGVAQKPIIPVPTPKVDFTSLAIQSYQLMLRDQTPTLALIHLEIHPRTFEGSELVMPKYFLNETDNIWSSFVGFVRGQEGLLFPNPKVLFGASMAMIFRHLTYTNWEYEKQRIKPVRIKQVERGIWQVIDEVKERQKPIAPPQQPEPAPITEQEHRFLVRGTFYHGKPVRGTRTDFREFPIDGESMDNYIKDFGYWILGFWNYSPKVVLYNPEGKDYIYGFNAHWGTVDASGRRGGETLTLKTSKEMNTYEYLLTLKSLMIGIAEIFSPNLKEPLYKIKPQEPLKLYMIQPHDRRFGNDPERSTAFIIHVEPGKYVYSPSAARQKVQEEMSKNANPNEIIATLIYGENSFVGPEGLAAISRMTNMLPHIRWMGILNLSKEGYIDFEEILTFTTKIQQPGVFDAGERLLRVRSSQCNEFVRKVVEKFGKQDAKFHILYESVSDLARRRTIVSLYCDGKIDKLRTEYPDAFTWINAIITAK